jgi:hypothetical protein
MIGDKDGYEMNTLSIKGFIIPPDGYYERMAKLEGLKEWVENQFWLNEQYAKIYGKKVAK